MGNHRRVRVLIRLKEEVTESTMIVCGKVISHTPSYIEVREDKYQKNVLSAIENGIVEIVEENDEEVVAADVDPADTLGEAVDKAEEPVAETAEEPVAETVEEPVAETVEEPVAETAEEPVAETVEEPVAETVEEPVSETVEEPVAETVEEPITEPVVETPAPAEAPKAKSKR